MYINWSQKVFAICGSSTTSFHGVGDDEDSRAGLDVIEAES